MNKNYLCAFFACALLLNTPCWAMQQQESLEDKDKNSQAYTPLEDQGFLRRNIVRKVLLLGTAASCVIAVPTAAYFIVSTLVALQAEKDKCDFVHLVKDIRDKGGDIIASCSFCKDSVPQSCNTTTLTVDSHNLLEPQGNPSVAFLTSCFCPLVDKYCNGQSPYVHCLNLQTMSRFKHVVFINKKSPQIYRTNYDLLYKDSLNCHGTFFRVTNQEAAMALIAKEEKMFGIKKMLNNQPRHQKNLTALQAHRHKQAKK